MRCSLPARSSSRSEEHTSELQSRLHLVCRLLLETKKLRGGLGLCQFMNRFHSPASTDEQPSLKSRMLHGGQIEKGHETPGVVERACCFVLSGAHHQNLHSFPTRRSSD